MSVIIRWFSLALLGVTLLAVTGCASSHRRNGRYDRYGNVYSERNRRDRDRYEREQQQRRHDDRDRNDNRDRWC